MGLIMRAVAWLVSHTFADNALRFVAVKALMTLFFVVILPIVLNNFIYDIINGALGWLGNSVHPGDYNPNASFSGLTAWFLTTLRFPETFSVVMGGLILRTSLRHIPFLRF